MFVRGYRMSDDVIKKKDEYNELRRIISDFQKIVDDTPSHRETEILMSNSIYSFTDAQMCRKFNV